ncbi:MAG: TetR/AcrR family transcriptional regulator [Pseudomonadota bacterium]
MYEIEAGNKEPESRIRILEAATRLFGRRGYHASTIENITQAAGISRGALYWHFKSKSEVLAAVVERLQREYLERFIEETMQGGSSAGERLNYIFKFNARFAVENVDLVHCLRTLSLELSPSEDEHVEAFFSILSRQREFIVGLILDGQKEGTVRDDIDANMLAAVILAVHDGILHQWTAFRSLWKGKDLAKAFRQVTLDGLARTGRFACRPQSSLSSGSTDPAERADQIEVNRCTDRLE